ncbi:hypothetical protein D3C71_2043240 [compost metagenome]
MTILIGYRIDVTLPKVARYRTNFEESALYFGLYGHTRNERNMLTKHHRLFYGFQRIKFQIRRKP